MILSYCRYAAGECKGILFFHQRTPTASGAAVAGKVFSAFVSHLNDNLHDKESTRIRTPDDLDDPEIQMLESLKTKTLRSLPQSPLYWGSEIFYVHATRENLYLKVPKWFRVMRMQMDQFHGLELDPTWTKLTTLADTTIFITLENNRPLPHRLISAPSGSIRIAPLLCHPVTEFMPMLSLNTVLETRS